MSLPEVQTYLVDDDDALSRLISYLKFPTFEYAVIDTETNHKSEARALLWGIGICVQDNEAFYIPFRRPDGSSYIYDPALLKALYEVLKTKRIIGHNVIYDILVLERNLQWYLTENIYSDTILQKHALDEDKPFGLKEVAVKYLGDWADKSAQVLYANIEAHGGRATKEQMDMWCADTIILADYCCWDTMLTWKLFHLFEPRIHAEGLAKLFYEEETMPLYKEVVIDMKRRGFHIDIEHFKKLREQIILDITKYEDEIQTEIFPLVEEKISELLNRDHPVSRKGNFPKAAANVLKISLPYGKNGKLSLARGGIENLRKTTFDPTELAFYEWVLDENAPCPFDPHRAQIDLFFAKTQNEGKRYVFNLNSGDHLRWLLFEKLKLKPISKTETGEPSVDAETLDEMAGQHPFCDRIIAFKKLNKLLSTYIDGVLDNHVSGIIYTSFLMFGTTSGRFSSRQINLQNLPSVKDEESDLDPLVLRYTNAIRKGFIAPPGYTLVNADYNSLEPCVFAHMSGDEGLREVFRRGLDLYSAIAIDIWKLKEYSADKKAENYLGKHRKDLRKIAKVIALAIPYGAESGRVADELSITKEEAQKIIDDYLNTYPNLKKYMKDSEASAKECGFVKTQFGRIRHLSSARELWKTHGSRLLDIRWASQRGLRDQRAALKNALNNAKNFPIQGLAAHITNRAMIAATRMFRAAGVDAWVAINCHDELCCPARVEQAEQARTILRTAMEQTTTISVPLRAEPLIANNWADAK